MTARAIRRLVAAVAMITVPFVLSACGEDQEKQAEIERLTEDLEIANENIDVGREDYERLKKEHGELRDSLRKEQKAARSLKSELASVKRELERYQDREQKEEERAAATATRKPGSREMREQAKEQVSAKLGALAEIKGDRTSGHGFLMEADGKVWVYFAAGTLAGNSKLEIKRPGGELLKKFGAFEVAADADLARLEVLAPPDEKLVSAGAVEVLPAAPLLGVSDVGVLMEDRSYEPKPDVLKVGSRIGRCPPGSPVFHGESGALLGVVTEPLDAERDLWRDTDSRTSSQRAVYRIDRKVEWKAMPIASFLAEARTIAETDRLTRLVYAFAAVKPGADGLSLDVSAGRGQSARQIFEENRSSSAVRALFDLEKWLEEKSGRAAEADIKKRINSVYSQMARTAGKQTREFEARKFSPFHQAIAKQSLAWRREAQNAFAETLKEIKK